MKSADLKNCAFRDQRTENYGDNVDHRSCNPAEDETVHEKSQIDCFESSEKSSRLAAVADLAELYVGQDFCAPPITRKEKHSQHAANAKPPPDPIARDAVAGNSAANK